MHAQAQDAAALMLFVLISASSIVVPVTARDPVTFVVFMVLGLLSYQPENKTGTLIVDTECYTDSIGKEYRGHVSETANGLPCQKWTSQNPHLHLYIQSLYPSSVGIGDHNYCRNPGSDPSPWCYTTDPYFRWDYCHVGFPSHSCNTTSIDEATASDNTEYLRIAIAVILPSLGGLFVSLITCGNTEGWYKSLKKPSIHPPKWILGPMWTYLYLTMGYASYLVWKNGGGFDGAKGPLGFYGTSLLLNWIWGPIYFSYHKLGLASAVIVAYLGTTGVTAYSFWAINKTASYLLFPLMGWLSLASSICIYTWRYNKDKSQ